MAGRAPLRGQGFSVELTPELVRAALVRARRTGTYWRLEPAERAVLALAPRLRSIRSPTLREILLRILEKVWPPRALVIRAYEVGRKVILRRAELALGLGMRGLAERILSLARDVRAVLVVGLSYLSTPAPYRIAL